ncbi:MAG: beta-aspartyl-peptidase [Bacillota bacterium]
MLTLIKNGEIYNPDYLGKKDILLINDRIHLIKENINIGENDLEIKIINADGNYVVPGFIDSHVHITGGGGEGGFHTRTPEIKFSDLISAGITTVIGCLGTDGITRSGEDLLAKTRALREEGISAYMYTGSYEFPVKTITGEIKKDIILINEILGVGEVAISDHRSSQPDISQLKKAAAEARVGGILANKAGIVNVHIGDGDRYLSFLEEIVDKTEIPRKQFISTHINRNIDLLEKGVDYALKGGLVDFTTSSSNDIYENKITKPSNSLKYYLEKGVNINNITFTSDGQGSLPEFNEEGEFVGLKVGKVSSLFKEVRDAVLKENIDLDKALKVITENPAQNLELKNKGKLKEEKDADLVILDSKDFKIKTVIAKGKVMLENENLKQKGTFE